MKRKFGANNTIGEIAGIFPEAMNIFLHYNIDFCCGGGRPLSQAIKEQQLDEQRIIDELNDSYEKGLEKVKVEKDFLKYTEEELMDYIVKTHHSYLREELPHIKMLTDKILRVHGENHPELKKVNELYTALKSELEQHLDKEEQVVFPLITKYSMTKDNTEREVMLVKIMEIEDEHQGAGKVLKELRLITKDYKIPADVCQSFVLTYNKLQELELDLFNHIHLENNILFKKL